MEYVTPFTENDYQRYSRHFIVKEMNGSDGMKMIKNAHVAVFGAGGLGCPLTAYLVGAGLGKLTLFDFDTIDMSNLSRQILYTTQDVGSNKVDVLAKRLRMLNPHVDIVAKCTKFCVENFDEFLDSSFTVIADCTDNMETRYLINELSLRLNIPLVSAGALIWSGQLTVYNYKGGPCFRCLFPDPPQNAAVTNRSCDQNGIIGPVVGCMGCLQATEVIKVILGEPVSTLASKLVIYDGFDSGFRKININGRRLNCPSCCSDKSLRKSYLPKLVLSVCQNDFSSPTPGVSVSVKELKEIVYKSKNIVSAIEKYIIIDVREPEEYSMIYFTNTLNVPLSEILKNGFRAISHLIHKDLTEVYVICHRGIRSRSACDILRKEKKAASLEHIKILNVIGGMDRWSLEVDNQLPRY